MTILILAVAIVGTGTVSAAVVAWSAGERRASEPASGRPAAGELLTASAAEEAPAARAQEQPEPLRRPPRPRYPLD
jgi:hypothetical protein